MIRLTGIGHVLLRVSDVERSKAFYSTVLGLQVTEQDPEHGGVFMALEGHARNRPRESEERLLPRSRRQYARDLLRAAQRAGDVPAGTARPRHAAHIRAAVRHHLSAGITSRVRTRSVRCICSMAN